MMPHPLVRRYLNRIEREAANLPPELKDSIVEEIQEHLREKESELSRAHGNGTPPKDEISAMLRKFGDPEEIVSEYRRQLSDDSVLLNGGSRSRRQGIAIIVLAIFVAFSLIFAVLFFFDSGDDDGGEDLGPEGPWLHDVAWKPSGDYAIVVGEGTPPMRYDGAGVEELQAYQGINFYDAAWHPDGDYALLCGSDGAIYSYDGAVFQSRSVTVDDTFRAVEFSPGGDFALAVGSSGVIAKVTDDATEHLYIPDGVIADVDLYDLSWQGDTNNVLMVGHDSDDFSSGRMLTLHMADGELSGGTFSLVQTPASLSTCFSTIWVEEWQCHIVTANNGQLFKIGDNWTVTSIVSSHGSAPITDAMWYPPENRLLLVGGVAGWDQTEGQYDLDDASWQVLAFDGEEVTLLEYGEGPHLLGCGYDQNDGLAIFVGSFDAIWEYKTGEMKRID